MRAPARAFGLLAGALALRAAPARSEPLAGYELSYAAEQDCPSRDSFESLVRAQLVDSREAPLGAPARLSVQLRRRAAGFAGRFELVQEDGSSVSRELEAATCTEVAPALAFVLALTLGKRPVVTGDQPAPPLRASASPPAREDHAVLDEAEAPRAPALRRDSGVAHPWRFAFGAELGARTGLGPIGTLTESGFLEVARSGVWRWASRLSLSRSETVTRVERAGTTDFSWWAIAASVCPLEVSRVQNLAILPCLGAHAGRMQARGRPAPRFGARGRDASELWLDGFAQLRLELEIGRVLFVEAQGQLIVPVTRYEFAFDSPDTLVYRVPALATAAALGLGARFP